MPQGIRDAVRPWTMRQKRRALEMAKRHAKRGNRTLADYFLDRAMQYAQVTEREVRQVREMLPSV